MKSQRMKGQETELSKAQSQESASLGTRFLVMGSLNYDYIYSLDHIVEPGETIASVKLDERFMEDYLMPSPIPEYDGHYSVDPKRHLMRYVYHVNRDKVFSDLFTKLANFG